MFSEKALLLEADFSAALVTIPEDEEQDFIPRSAMEMQRERTNEMSQV